MVEYRSSGTGRLNRVHREYVDVITRIGRDGVIEPVCVCWRDGRSFPIDEVLETGTFGARANGRRQARYRVRLGNHETELYLEKADAVAGLGRPETLRWWVFAVDSPHQRVKGAGDG